MFEILPLRFANGSRVGRSIWKAGYIALSLHVVRHRVNENLLVVWKLDYQGVAVAGKDNGVLSIKNSAGLVPVFVMAMRIPRYGKMSGLFATAAQGTSLRGSWQANSS